MSAVVLTGSKLALVGLLLIITVLYVRSIKLERTRLAQLLAMLIMVFSTYALLFPAVIAHNFYIDAFEVSFLGRFADAIAVLAPQLANSQQLSSIMESYYAIVGRDTNAGDLSGIVDLVLLLPYVIGALILASPWLVLLFRKCKEISPEVTRTSVIMMLVVFLIPFATSLFGSQFYAVCVGIALAPVLSSSRSLRHFQNTRSRLDLVPLK